jgi:hypothetical protein
VVHPNAELLHRPRSVALTTDAGTGANTKAVNPRPQNLSGRATAFVKATTVTATTVTATTLLTCKCAG